MSSGPAGIPQQLRTGGPCTPCAPHPFPPSISLCRGHHLVVLKSYVIDLHIRRLKPLFCFRAQVCGLGLLLPRVTENVRRLSYSFPYLGNLPESSATVCGRKEKCQPFSLATGGHPQIPLTQSTGPFPYNEFGQTAETAPQNS